MMSHRITLEFSDEAAAGMRRLEQVLDADVGHIIAADLGELWAEHLPEEDNPFDDVDAIAEAYLDAATRPA